MKHGANRIALALLLSSIVGCSGGGGGTGVPAPSVVATPTATPVAKQTLVAGSAKIFIPAKPATANIRPAATTFRGHPRRRLWVSPSTESVSITATAVDGFMGSVITAVPANSPNCTAVTGGRTCTLAFNAPPGVDTIQIYAYDQPDAYNGAPVATTTVTGVNIAAQGNNTFTFTLGGIVGEPILLSPTSFSVTQGTPQDLTLSIVGEDYDFNPITKYDSPLTITQTDTTGTFTLSATSIADSSITPSITIHYNGGTASTTITVATTSTDTANDYNQQTSSIAITPTLTQTTGVFLAAGTAGVKVYSPTTGALLSTFASSFGASSLAMDNSGDVFLSNANEAIARFAIGGNTATATYTPTVGANQPYLLTVSPQGTLIASGLDTETGNETFDEWDAGVTGTPSRTIVRQDGALLALPAVGPDGSIFIAYDSDSGTEIDHIPVGSTSNDYTIGEPDRFVPATAAVAPDGTFYVGENNFEGDDLQAGLYVNAFDASQVMVTNGAPAPAAIDTDDAGNVYVVNNNSYNNDAGFTTDTSHLYTVFGPGATTIVRQVSSGFSNAQTLTVSGDGTETYLLDYPLFESSQATLEKLVPSSTSPTNIATVGATNIVLFDGSRAKAIRGGAMVVGRASHGKFVALRRLLSGRR